MQFFPGWSWEWNWLWHCFCPRAMLSPRGRASPFFVLMLLPASSHGSTECDPGGTLVPDFRWTQLLKGRSFNPFWTCFPGLSTSSESPTELWLSDPEPQGVTCPKSRPYLPNSQRLPYPYPSPRILDKYLLVHLCSDPLETSQELCIQIPIGLGRLLSFLQGSVFPIYKMEGIS